MYIYIYIHITTKYQRQSPHARSGDLDGAWASLGSLA